MKVIKVCVFFIAAYLLLGVSQSKPVRIFMAGDSTMASQKEFKTVTDSLTGEKVGEPLLLKGWGQFLPDFFDKDVKVVNRALSGRSSLSFRTEGHWDKLIVQVTLPI